MRSRGVGILLGFVLSQSALSAQADSATGRRHPWVAFGVQQLGRWGEVVISGSASGPSRTVLLHPAGDKVGFQAIAGIPTHWKDLDIELYGQTTGKRALQDSTGQSLGNVQEVILAVGINRGMFRQRDAHINLYVAGRLGVGLLKYEETIPVGLPKTAVAALISAESGLVFKLAPSVKLRVAVGVTPATAGPLFYSVTGGLAVRLPL